MKPWPFRPLALYGSLCLLVGITLWGIPHLPDLERTIFEQLMNRNSNALFNGSIHIHKARLDRRFQVQLLGLSGKFQTRHGPVALEINALASQDSLFNLLVYKPVRFRFEGLHPKGSLHLGVSGTVLVQTGPASRFELVADFGNTALEDLQWIDPQNLGAATGALKGTLTFRQLPGQDPMFMMDLEAPPPGGNIQARFFDLFLPYLPSPVQQEKVRKVSQSHKIVRYDNASVQVELPQGDRMKVLLHVLVRDYNLKLTVNADLRADQKNAFSQIAQLLGLIEVK